MSQVLSKWVVMAEHAVTEDDLDGGVVSVAALARWADGARSDYLSRCAKLQARGRLELRPGTVPPAALLGHPGFVAVSASVTEVRPQSFTLAVRVRPLEGDRETPLNVTTVVRIGDAEELGTDIRDELIALEHAAAHYN